MLDLISCMKSFVRTVETGSFSAVAREMNTSQPTISKQIAALEEYLDVQLLVRSTRTMNMTHAVYRRGRFQSAKVKCFIDFLLDEFNLGLS